MNAGRFRERITVEQKSGTPDAANVRTGWSTYCSRRAEVTAMSGREGMLGRQVQATADYLITVRDDATTRAITPRMQVVWKGKTLKIESALLKGEDVELACTTVA